MIDHSHYLCVNFPTATGGRVLNFVPDSRFQFYLLGLCWQKRLVKKGHVSHFNTNKQESTTSSLSLAARVLSSSLKSLKIGAHSNAWKLIDKESCFSEFTGMLSPSGAAAIMQSWFLCASEQWKPCSSELLVREVTSIVCMAEQGCWVLSIPWEAVNQSISQLAQYQATGARGREGHPRHHCKLDAVTGSLTLLVPKMPRSVRWSRRRDSKDDFLSGSVKPYGTPCCLVYKEAFINSKVSMNKMQTISHCPRTELPMADFSRRLVLGLMMSLECRLAGTMRGSTWQPRILRSKKLCQRRCQRGYKLKISASGCCFTGLPDLKEIHPKEIYLERLSHLRKCTTRMNELIPARSQIAYRGVYFIYCRILGEFLPLPS